MIWRCHGVSCGHNFLLTRRSSLGDLRHLEHAHKSRRKLSWDLWKKFQLKTWAFVRIFQLEFKLTVIFSKYQRFSLFLTYNLTGVSCSHVFSPTQRCNFRSGEISGDLEHVREVHRKDSMGPWYKFQLKTWEGNEAEWNVSWNFFQKPLENFPWT